MALLKLYQVATPTVAAQVTATHTPVRRCVISNSGANSTSVGDSTMTTAATGIVIASGTTLTLGSTNSSTAFDLSELYVIAATGNVNVLATLL
jgi:hypothetical protein